MRLLVLATVLIVSLGLGGCFSTASEKPATKMTKVEASIQDTSPVYEIYSKKPHMARDNTYDGSHADAVMRMDCPGEMHPIVPSKYRVRRAKSVQNDELHRYMLRLTTADRWGRKISPVLLEEIRSAKSREEIFQTLGFVRDRIFDDKLSNQFTLFYLSMLPRGEGFDGTIALFSISHMLTNIIDRNRCENWMGARNANFIKRSEAAKPYTERAKKFFRSASKEVRLNVYKSAIGIERRTASFRRDPDLCRGGFGYLDSTKVKKITDCSKPRADGTKPSFETKCVELAERHEVKTKWMPEDHWRKKRIEALEFFTFEKVSDMMLERGDFAPK